MCVCVCGVQHFESVYSCWICCCCCFCAMEQLTDNQQQQQQYQQQQEQEQQQQQQQQQNHHPFSVSPPYFRRFRGARDIQGFFLRVVSFSNTRRSPEAGFNVGRPIVSSVLLNTIKADSSTFRHHVIHYYATLLIKDMIIFVP